MKSEYSKVICSTCGREYRSDFPSPFGDGTGLFGLISVKRIHGTSCHSDTTYECHVCPQEECMKKIPEIMTGKPVFAHELVTYTSRTCDVCGRKHEKPTGRHQAIGGTPWAGWFEIKIDNVTKDACSPTCKVALLQNEITATKP